MLPYKVLVHLAKRFQRNIFFYKLTNQKQELPMSGGHCGLDRIAVGFTSITTIATLICVNVLELHHSME
jgi:hypothetical protein